MGYLQQNKRKKENRPKSSVGTNLGVSSKVNGTRNHGLCHYFWREREEEFEFKDILGYIVSCYTQKLEMKGGRKKQK